MNFPALEKVYSYKKFCQQMSDLLESNNCKEDVLVRVSWFIDAINAGTKMYQLPASLSAYLYPTPQFYPENGVRVCVSSWQRTADNSIPSRAKVNGSYANASLMKNEALLNGFDEAISLDAHGHVAEGSVANLFMVRGGVLVTPATSTDILEGITRDTVIAIADFLGIPHQERDIDRSELYLCDELFFSGSSAQIAPIISVDHRIIGAGKVGAVSKKIAYHYGGLQTGIEYQSKLAKLTTKL
jgi:branched-chain amino acid aminotransferase